MHLGYDALAGHAAAAALILLQGLLGACLLHATGWGGRLAGGLERALYAWVVGVGAGTALLMPLAAFGVLGAPAVLGLSAAILATALVVLGRPHLPRARPGARALCFVGLGLAAGVAWLWPVLVQTALPNSDWDSALYHLALADRYLAGDFLNRDPLFSAYSFPGAVSLMYAALMAVGLERAVVPLNFQVTGILLAGSYLLGRSLGGRRAGVWSLVVVAGTHIIWQLAADPRIDGFLSAFVLIAGCAFVAWLRGGPPAPYLYLVALALGAGLGAKYTGLVFAGVLVATGFLVLAVPRLRPERLPGVREIALCAALLLVPNGLWYLSNVLVHGDPFVPMLRGEYYPPGPGSSDPRPAIKDTAAALLEALPEDSPVWQEAETLEERRRAPMPRTLLDPVSLLVHPEQHSAKPNQFVSPLLLAALFVPFALGGLSPGRRRAALVLYGLTWFCYLGFGSLTYLVRYVMPLLALLAALAGLVLARPRSRVWQGAFALIALGVFAHHHLAEREKLANLEPDLFLSGRADRVSWLAEVGYNQTPAMPRMVERIHDEVAAGRVAPDAKVLMIGEGKGRLLGLDYLPDGSWFMKRWLVELIHADFDYDAVERSLAAQGVTHLLYNPSYYRWVSARTDTPVGRVALPKHHIDRYLRSRGRIVVRTPSMVLLELPSSGASPR